MSAMIRGFLAGAALVLVIVLVAGVAVIDRLPRPAASTSPTPSLSLTPTPAAPSLGVTARARVVPVRSAELSFPITGTIRDVFVRERQEVGEGDLLIRLDQEQRRIAVDEAEAELNQALAARTRAEAERRVLPQDASTAVRQAADAEVAFAEAEVAAARAALEQARQTLEQTELRAPFDGTIASIEANEGEVATPDRPLVTIGDLSAWQVETRNLDELDVVRLAENDPATITFDALPGVRLAGVIEQIQVRGVTDDGGVTYTVVIRPDRFDQRLRWNMSALVIFDPQR